MNMEYVIKYFLITRFAIFRTQTYLNFCMGIIPGFLYDVFISYAHIDNRRSATQSKGWIDEFHNELSLLLIQHFGIEPKIWYDNTKLDNSTIFDSSIKKGVVNSAIIVCINSPSYTTSKYCLEELEFFHAKSAGNLVISDRSRIIHVLLNNIPHKTWPMPLAGATGFRFFNSKGADHLGDRVKIKSSKFEKEMQGLRDSIANLTKDICIRQNSDNPIIDEVKVETIEEIIAARKTTAETYDLPIGQLSDPLKKAQPVPKILTLPNKEESTNEVTEYTNRKNSAPVEIEKEQRPVSGNVADTRANNEVDLSKSIQKQTVADSSNIIEDKSNNEHKSLYGSKIKSKPLPWLKIAVLLVAGIFLAGIFAWRAKDKGLSVLVVNRKDTTVDIKHLISDNQKMRAVLLHLNGMQDANERAQKEALTNTVNTFFNPAFIVNLKYERKMSNAVPQSGVSYLSDLFIKNQIADIIVTRLVSTNHKIDSIDIVEVHKKALDVKIIK